MPKTIVENLELLQSTKTRIKDAITNTFNVDPGDEYAKYAEYIKYEGTPDNLEVKNSNVGNGSKMSHLAYIGDADVGSGVNIGCGVVFVNYNGREKFRAKVGDNAFIGSNSNLVAPIEVEDEAYIAAGSTITKNVLKGQLSLERAPQKNIDGWVKRKGFVK